MLKNFTLVSFMLICLYAISVSAQTAPSPEKQAVIKELVAMINADNKLEDITNATAQQLQEQQNAMMKVMISDDTHLSESEKKKLVEASIARRKDWSQRLTTKISQKMNYNRAMSEIIGDVYDKYYTLDELKDLVAFYKTPTGSKVLKTMSPVMQDTLTLVRERLNPDNDSCYQGDSGRRPARNRTTDKSAETQTVKHKSSHTFPVLL